MVYPIVVIGVAVLIVALLMIVVVPKFQTIFEDMLSDALPGPTQLVVNFSNFMQQQFILSVGIIIAAVFGFKFLLDPFGAKIFNWCSINLPKVGDLVRKVNIARIARTFGTLLPVEFRSYSPSRSRKILLEMPSMPAR